MFNYLSDLTVRLALAGTTALIELGNQIGDACNPHYIA